MPKQRRTIVILIVVAATIAAFLGFRALTKGDGPEKISLDRYTRDLAAGKVATRDDLRPGPHRQGQAGRRHRVHRRLPGAVHRTVDRRRRRRRRRQVRDRPPEPEHVGELAVRAAPVRAARARADVGARAGAGWRRPRDGLRQGEGEDAVEGPTEGHVRRRRRARRGGRGAGGDQGVPRIAGEVPE